jgi:N-acetylglucosaminyldiphosphoundecaprenol N-acetyl-beta-D-mannosaminyltransferase
MLNRRSRYRLLDIEVDALTQSELNTAVREAVDSGSSRIIANHNLHSMLLYRQQPRMREFYTLSDYIVIDGMSIVLLGRLLGLPLKRSQRLAMLDCLGPIFAEAAQKGWRLFHLGNTSKVARDGAAGLRARYPGLQIMAEQGYFDATPGSEDNRRIIEKIHSYRPHIVLVGMGMPRQEHWIIDHVDQLSGMVIFNVGAYLGYVAGAIATPPRWIGQIGLEWFFRLCNEPERLGRRYLVEPWSLLRLVLQLGNRKLQSHEDSGL